MNSHKHHIHDGLEVGSGTIHLNSESVRFVEGVLYLETHEQKEEQRMCVFLASLPAQKIQPGTQPFAEVTFDDPLRLGNIPLSRLKIFVLSATLIGTQFDGVISPKINKLDPYIRPSY